MPGLFSEEFGLLISGPAMVSNLSGFGESCIPLWKAAVVGGGGKASCSGRGSTPFSTHRLSFSS